MRIVGERAGKEAWDMHEIIDDMAPWVAEVFDRLSRINGELAGDLTDSELRVAVMDELDRAPRAVTREELSRGCAIATELMMVEATERALATLDAASVSR